ncbi:MAG: septum formation initiator family protein [Deltaproteobacteria bacterium]|nr:septum formation initiator family protein [Deltaproteobacteria bacterium]
MALPPAKKAEKEAKKAKKPWSGLFALNKAPGGKLFWLAMLLVSLAIGSFLFFGDKGLYHLYQLRQELEQLLQANLALRDENERLVNIIERLQNDQDFIQDTIRQELNYIKRNEIIYQLVPEVGSGPRFTQAPALGPPPTPAAKPKKTGRANKRE